MPGAVQPQYPMTTSRNKHHAAPTARELRLDLGLAQRWAKTAAGNAKVARTEYKRSRKAYRQAKRIAKEARKELKALKKKLEATLASASAPKPAKSASRPTKKSPPAVRKSRATKLVGTNPPKSRPDAAIVPPVVTADSSVAFETDPTAAPAASGSAATTSDQAS